MKTSDEIQKIADEILEVLEANRVATPNDYAVNRLRFLASRLHGKHTSASEKARKIANIATTFYSIRKHANAQYGATGLHHEMTSLVGQIRRAAHLKAATGD